MRAIPPTQLFNVSTFLQEIVLLPEFNPGSITVPSPVSLAGHTSFERFKVEIFPGPTSCWLIANNSSYPLLNTGHRARDYAKQALYGH